MIGLVKQNIEFTLKKDGFLHYLKPKQPFGSQVRKSGLSRISDLCIAPSERQLCGRSCRLCQGSEWPFSVESLQTITTGIPPNKASVPSLSIPQYPASTAISEVSLRQIKKADLGK